MVSGAGAGVNIRLIGRMPIGRMHHSVPLSVILGTNAPIVLTSRRSYSEPVKGGKRALIFDFSTACGPYLVSHSPKRLVGRPQITTIPGRPTASATGYIVVFAPGTSPGARANAVLAAGARTTALTTQVPTPPQSPHPSSNVVESLRRSPGVTRVVPDFIVRNQAKGGRGGPPATPVTFDTRQVIPLGSPARRSARDGF
jgi:hypothetical protein